MAALGKFWYLRPLLSLKSSDFISKQLNAVVVLKTLTIYAAGVHRDVRKAVIPVGHWWWIYRTKSCVPESSWETGTLGLFVTSWSITLPFFVQATWYRFQYRYGTGTGTGSCKQSDIAIDGRWQKTPGVYYVWKTASFIIVSTMFGSSEANPTGNVKTLAVEGAKKLKKTGHYWFLKGERLRFDSCNFWWFL